MLKCDFYDDETESMIDLSAFYGESKQIVDKCMIFWRREMSSGIADMKRKDSKEQIIILVRH